MKLSFAAVATTTALLLVLLLQPSLAFAPAAPAATRIVEVPLPLPVTTSTRSSQLHAFIPRRSSNSNNSKQSHRRLASSSIHSSTTVNGSTASSNRRACFPTDTPWEVHKFGGASLASADLYRTVGDLLLREQSRKAHDSDKSESNKSESSSNHHQKLIPTMAVVSARGGMTDLLVKVVDSALVNVQDAERALDEAVATQLEVLQELAPAEITRPIEQSIRNDARDILSVVQSLRMLNTVPAVTMEVVTGFGEIWSAQTLYAYLQTIKPDSTAWIDARDILIVESNSAGLGEKGSTSTTGVTPLWEQTSAIMDAWWDKQSFGNTGSSSDNNESESPIIIVTGFVAKTADGVPTTLKRSGSDYSATIFAKLVAADRVTMWKNTDGVYTADPRAVPEAFSIASLKYDEASELSYFGAAVLHPTAMVPLMEENIPCYVRNIFNPAFEGTVIQGRSRTLRDVLTTGQVNNWRSRSGDIPIKGVTSVEKISLVTLEGASIGGCNVAERFMGAMADADISVLIITQASSESSITVAVPENQGRLALRALENTFELELARSTVGSVSLSTGMSIVAIVGEGMASTSGVSSTFMSSLARANVNIRVIAQGSSERQIAVVVNGSDTSRALRAAHMAFTLSETRASLAILGSRGYVGRAFCEQIAKQNTELAKDLGISISVTAAATSKFMVFGKDSRGLETSRLSELLHSDDAEAFDLEKMTANIAADINPLRVVIDCTNSDEVGDYYERWLSMGCSIISPGRRVGAGNLDRYHKIARAQREHAVNVYSESSVGSALPIISTLHDLLETGDTIRSISGSVSGTMAYTLSTMSEEVSFSDALRGAISLDIPENDLRVDTSGTDTAEKVVILARQAGLDVSLEDVEIENILPEEIISKRYYDKDGGGDDAVLEDIKRLMDGPMLKEFKNAKSSGRRLRYKFEIDMESGKCRCFLDSVDTYDPCFRLMRNQNLVAFDTCRYETSPLIVKGAAAGPELSAAGIFADLLRLTRAFSSNR